jgi:cell wall-associated NlpC family hydrolase
METKNKLGLAPCPAFIAQKALEYATEYSKADTEYQFGGQDLLRSIKIDCSGLVVNCYYYAIKNTMYSLPFDDAAVIDFYVLYSKKTTTPMPGDLVFMGDKAASNPTHVGLFAREENGEIYFIDSTYKPVDGINGVSERHYPKNDDRFLSFGMLLLNHQQK